MKILYICNRVPFPPDGGYPIVVYNTLKGMLSEGAELTVFCLNPAKHYVDIGKLNDPLLAEIKLLSSYINTSIKPWQAFKNYVLKRSYNVSRFYKPHVINQLKNLLRTNVFEIIQLEGLFVVPYLSLIRQLSRAKIIYRAHNIEYQIWERLASVEKFPLRKFYLNSLAKRLKEFEHAHINQFDAVATISEADLRELQYLGCNIRLENFSVVIDPDDYQPDSTRVEALSVFHLGSMDWIPNQEAVEWFVENVWTDLEELNAGLTFHIAGNNIPREFLDYGGEAIKVHPNVEDARRFMNSKYIMVVPLQAASGMRVKIIEGMALGKCIISTSIGAEGIRYEHGINILIADTADDFYRYILQCASDREFAERIGQNARMLVEKEHDLKTASKRLMHFYDNLLAG